MLKLRSGRCCICGCSDRRGCPSGCWWADAYHVLCSRCARNMAILAMVLRKRADNAT
jgi:hypothetical protein